LRETPFATRMIATAAVAGAALAVLLNPFLAGGLIGALTRDPGVDAGGRGARFAADGVRHYGPLLRVALIVWPAAAIATGAAALAAGAVFSASPAPALALAAGGLVIAVGAFLATTLIDLARIHVVRGDTRRALAAVGAAIGLAFRHAPRVLRLALAFGTLLAIAGAGLLALRGWLAGETWLSITAGLVAQQAHAFARTWLRAALVGGEVVLVEADAERRRLAASVAAGEERPQMLVVVQGEAGEGALAGDERDGGGDLPTEIPGRLAAEGDAGRRDADAEESGPALAALAGDRRRDEPPPVA
jgi:hypothetical protein